MARDSTFTMSKANELEGSSNYAIWKAKMKAIFMKEKLWGTICPIFIRATTGGMSIATSTKTSTEATTPLTSNATEIVAINDKKNQAMAILLLSIKDDIICYIIDQKEPSAY
jgi:hypothetical protein